MFQFRNEIKGLTGFWFHPKPEAEDYADCTGLYVCDESKGLFNNNPVFLNAEKERILVSHLGSGWTITALEYWDHLQTISSNFGGFHSIPAGYPHSGDWEQYNVVVISDFNKPTTHSN